MAVAPPAQAVEHSKSPAPVGSSGAAAAPTLPVEPMAVADAMVDAATPEAPQVPAEPVKPASLVMKA